MRFKCPHCKENSNLDKSDIKEGDVFLDIPNSGGLRKLKTTFYICQNPDCNKHTIDIEISKWMRQGSGHYHTGIEREIRIKPDESVEVKDFPEYIPQQILSDYYEASLIKKLSPKASATLSRRCLQGMIRDFWGIKEKNLFLEINALEGKIDDLTREAIDAVRSIGNIGAHMEADINSIIDVEDDEAQLLVELIETLIEEWYIARHEKEVRMKKLIEAKNKKIQQKKQM